jgi:uncharacterized membrane protein
MGRYFRSRLVGGLLLLIPLAITYLVLSAIWGLLQDPFRPLLSRVPGPVSGIALDILGFLVLIILIYLVGAVGRTLVGGRILRIWESGLDRIPIVRPIYRIARQSTQVIAGGMGLQSTSVVMLEYPRAGVLSLGLVTGQYVNAANETFLTIYIPTIPNPTSGFLAMVKKEQVIETDMNFEDAMKIVISAGVLMEEVVRNRQEANEQ